MPLSTAARDADTIALCPPLVITEGQIEELVTAFERTLEDTARWIADGKLTY
ncbi:hypothetical protein LJR255_005107 [Pararhizobium sp. LjRoot255]|uniref:hypothetical protein n=1 Tax=Pararhizobium sp. LjRoot255 TaxID=3342298 RepID=UPI003ECC9205